MKTLILYALLFILLSIVLISSNMYAQQTPVKINDVSVNLPGKWKLINHNEDAGQYGFLEVEKKISLAISVRNAPKMDFYKSDLSDIQLVKAYYTWDSDYWKTGKDVEVNVLKTDTAKKSIIWQLKTKQGENIILFGMKNRKLVGLFLNMNRNIQMSKDEAVFFLQEIYSN